MGRKRCNYYIILKFIKREKERKPNSTKVSKKLNLAKFRKFRKLENLYMENWAKIVI
jgi:hypothetical protein